MQTRFRLPAFFALALCAPVAYAAPAGEPVQECVELGGGHKVSRYGSQFVLVEDGDARYRVSVDSDCDVLSLATRIELSTDGEEGRVCPSGSQVKTNNGECSVALVERIDAQTHARYLRRRR